MVEMDAPETRLERWVYGIMTVLKWMGYISLTLMMFLTALDVAGRYLFNRPISGSLELVEYMMAVLIPFSIAYCAVRRAHVAVEFIMDLFSRKVQQRVDLVIKLVTLVFVAVIAWQTCYYVAETYRSHVTSSVLLIETYPFVVPIVVGMALFVLVLVNEVLQLVGKIPSSKGGKSS